MVLENPLKLLREAFDVKQADGGGRGVQLIFPFFSEGAVRLVGGLKNPIFVAIGFQDLSNVANFYFLISWLCDVGPCPVKQGTHHRALVVEVVRRLPVQVLVRVGGLVEDFGVDASIIFFFIFLFIL